jgi:hypothetical protein
MNLEIRRPELVQRVRAEIQNRHLHDADELLEQALDALNEKFPRPGESDWRGGACSVAGSPLSRRRSHAAPRASQRAGRFARMAWLLDTNILSERRKPKPEPKCDAPR